MKKVRKIEIIFMIFMVISLLVSSAVLAEQQTLGDVLDQADSWLNSSDTSVNTEPIAETIKPIAQAITSVGVGVILCATVIMGIKWVMASPDQQAKLKQQSIGLLVAAIVVFGAYTIWKIAYQIANEF